VTLSRRRLLAGALAGGIGVALAACTSRTPPSPSPSPSSPIGALWEGPLPFASGASCIGAADGQFARWRSFNTAVHGNWATDGSTVSMEEGEEYGSWPGDLDFAPQYYLEDSGGFRWSACAKGDYDDRFREDLNSLKEIWGDRPGRLYYRFQHEFNGTWYPWSVAGDRQVDQFMQGWRRFGDVFHDVFGGDDRFRLTWSPNAGVDSSPVSDIRNLYPGADYVDVIGIDYYDFFPLESDDDWSAQLAAEDSGGGPIGIGRWREFAEEQGKPLALAEWGQQYGDNPLFIEKIHDFLAEHAFSGGDSDAGKVIYEIYFNQQLNDGTPHSEGDFRLQIDGRDHPERPRAARAYRELWRSLDR
jgi:Glycosyl hydrolase family 26